ncbi:MAG: alcohol dehydrogenase catalytic domain-containing protein, partial [Myxococcota bacterium]
MQALRFVGDELRLEEVPEPRPGAGEVGLRLRTGGVCNTDLELVRGYMGFEGTLGHELVATVETLGPGVDPAWVGARVCVDINFACGACATCVAGDPHHCPTRGVLGLAGRDGAFAERLVAPVTNLYRVPAQVSDDAAVFTEPLAAAFEILAQVAVKEDTRVLVLGDGKLGLLCAFALATTGCDLVVAGRHDRKLALAEAAGLRVTRSLGEARGFDVVVEATGRETGLAEAQDRVRPRGTIVLKSTFAGTPRVDTNRLVIDEVRLVGSRCGPFDRALEALARGEVDPTPLIDARYALRDGVKAMEHAGRRGT